MTSRQPGGRPSTLPEPWLSLAMAYGGVQQLAEACGVQRMAIHRWASGDRTPGVLVQRAVNAMAKRRGIAEPWPK